MSCNHADCFTCPYSDCIATVKELNHEKKKPGRKKMNEEEVRKHRLAYQREYYRRHKERQRAYYKKYNAEHLKLTPKKDLMWITDGINNKRVGINEIDEYLSKGWRRGRTNRT